MNSQNQNQQPRTTEERDQQSTSTPTPETQQTSTTRTPQTPERSEELDRTELEETNGGSLLGNDNSSLTALVGGTVNLSHTDEDGDTESTNLDFGTGSLLNTSND